MNDIEKFLKKLSAKEYEALELIFRQMKKDYRQVPGLLKLTGAKNLYRFRVGRIRCVFRVQGNQLTIVRLTWRNEATYKHL